MPRRFVPTPRRTKPSVIQPLPDDDTAWRRLPSVLHYAGMGHTKFYELVGKQLMPKPKLICGRSYWLAGEIREAVKKLEGGLPELCMIAIRRAQKNAYFKGGGIAQFRFVGLGTNIDISS